MKFKFFSCSWVAPFSCRALRNAECSKSRKAFVVSVYPMVNSDFGLGRVSVGLNGSRYPTGCYNVSPTKALKLSSSTRYNVDVVSMSMYYDEDTREVILDNQSSLNDIDVMYERGVKGKWTAGLGNVRTFTPHK